MNNECTYSLTILSLYENNTNVNQRGISLQTTLFSAFLGLTCVAFHSARLQYYMATQKRLVGKSKLCTGSPLSVYFYTCTSSFSIFVERFIYKKKKKNHCRFRLIEDTQFYLQSKLFILNKQIKESLSASF